MINGSKKSSAKSRYLKEMERWKNLHQIHVVQSDVVELCVLNDGGGAGVVGRVHQGEDLGGRGYPPL